MMEQEASEQSNAQNQQQTASFASDPNVQNPCESEEKPELVLGLGLGLGLGVESKEETAPFCSDRPNVENPSGGNDQTDENNCDDDDDEEVERIINEELRNLVLSQAINEQQSLVDHEENGEEEEEEEDAEMGGGNVEDKFENEENGNVGKEEGRFNSVRKFAYPLRPDAEDCAFYMKTGSCKFGANCKFNHPPIPRRKFQGTKEKVKQRDEHLERPGQTECKYYLTSGGCKYGKACKYNHPREKSSAAPTAEFNFLGLPIRPGEKDCTYYMRNGSCKYGSNCRFNHPDPTAVAGNDPSRYGNGGSLPGPAQSSVSLWPSPRALNETASYVPMMFPPTQGIPSTPEWNGYQAPVYTTSERGLPTPPAFTMNNLAAETNFNSLPQPMLGEEFPERPGHPECSYFLKTGDCKYKFNCKFHHPKSRNNNSSSCALSDKGLPLRPDQAVCSFYNRYGICKFGPSCKFDHPENLGSSVSSAVSNYE